MNSQLATKEEKRAYFLHLLQEVVPTLMRIEKVAFKAFFSLSNNISSAGTSVEFFLERKFL